MSTGPIETKVTSATFGAAIAGVAVWALQTYVFESDVPLPVQALIGIAVPAVAAFVAGYSAKHTTRNDPDARAGGGGLETKTRPGGRSGRDM